jgi:hemophore-related protein
MKLTGSTVRRGLLGAFASSALGAAAAATIAVPSANAAPCTAAGLSNTVSSVAGAAGQYLDTHPDADDALTRAGSQSTGDAEASLRAYFLAHPQQFNDLRGIARPLTDLRGQCGSTVSPGQISALLNAFSV